MPDPTMRERVRAALIAAPPGREVDAVMELLEPAPRPALLEALAPFVAYWHASMASRSPGLPDSAGIATIHNNIDGDTAITVADLRRLVSAAAQLTEAPPADGVHEYLSTACWHAQADDTKHLHNLCRLTCKWCPEQCRCTCHEPGEEAPDGR